MLIRTVEINPVAPRARLEDNPPPFQHRRLGLPARLIPGEETVCDIVEFQPAAGLEMREAALHETGPVADTIYEHAAVNHVERRRRRWRLRGGGGGGKQRQRPVALCVCDGEPAVWWRRGRWLGERDVETEDVGVWLFSREGDGPDAGAAAHVEDAHVVGVCWCS